MLYHFGPESAPGLASRRLMLASLYLLTLTVAGVALAVVPYAHASALCDVECEECVGATTVPLPIRVGSIAQAIRPSGADLPPELELPTPHIQASAHPRPPPSPAPTSIH